MFGKLLASKPSKAGRATAAATVMSVVFHGVIVTGAVWATLAWGEEATSEPEEQVTLIQLVEEMPQPPLRPNPPVPEQKPPPAEPPPVPPEPRSPVNEEAKGFQTLAEPESIPTDIPPSGAVAFDESDFSGEGVEGGRGGGDLEAESTGGVEDGPTVTLYSVPPVLLNRNEVAERVTRLYPRALKKLGVGGRVMIWILIDAEGRVARSVLRQTSGRDTFDQAALKVAEIMRFEPALYSDEPVAVWLTVPIRFKME